MPPSVAYYSSNKLLTPKLTIFDQEYNTDDWTSVSPSIMNKINKNLLHNKSHPLYHLANKIKYFFQKTYLTRANAPIFSIYDNLRPLVTVEQNFDRCYLNTVDFLLLN
jgi:phenylalanyl-tRNA synthetase alpha chain